MEGLYCGSSFSPASEKGPLKAARIVDMFKGKPYIMGHTAEFVAQMYDISREEMDEVALRSHNNVERATKDGDFKEEIVPVEIPQKKGKPPVIFDKDEHFMPGHHHGQARGAAPGIHPQDRQGHGRQCLGHQRRRGCHDHHVRREGQGAGPEAHRKDSRRWATAAATPPSWG